MADSASVDLATARPFARSTASRWPCVGCSALALLEGAVRSHSTARQTAQIFASSPDPGSDGKRLGSL